MRAYGSIQHAFNVIVEDKGKGLFVRRRCEPYKGLWSLPSGYIKYGEIVENETSRSTDEIVKTF